ncbi:MAG: M48 family metallopeptidase [Pseudomonadota bacterium]
MIRSFRAATIALIAAIGVSACAPTTQNTRASLAQEQQRSQGHVRDLESKGGIIKDAGLNQYLQSIVNRIAPQRAPGSVGLRSYIIKNADVNAYTSGGGYIFFNAGLMAAMENEAQLATVVAHEIAHIDRGHIPAQQANNQAVQLGAVLGTLAGAAVGINPQVTEMVVGLGANAYASNYSRTQERDADSIAARYLAAAGYNGAEGAKSFQVLQRLYGNNRGVFSTHPAPAERFNNLTVQARQLGSTQGRIGKQTHDRATRKVRQELLAFYEKNDRDREAAQIRRTLR